MKVVITSKNKDKINITKRLLLIIRPDLEIFSLEDFDITKEYEERGSISDRASGKANFYKEILDKKNCEYDAVLGIDDGLAIPGFADDTPFSKELTDKILAGEYPIGTKILNKRAYALVLSSGEEKNCIEENPFEFVGNKNNVKREEGVYPLTKVLSAVGYSETLAEMDNKQETEYYLKYARELLTELFS